MMGLSPVQSAPLPDPNLAKKMLVHDPKKHHGAMSFEELGRYLFEASAVCQIISAAFTLQVAFNLVFTIGGSINISGAVLCGILVDSCGPRGGILTGLVLIMDPQTRARNLVYKPIPEEFQVCRHSIIGMNGVKSVRVSTSFYIAMIRNYITANVIKYTYIYI